MSTQRAAKYLPLLPWAGGLNVSVDPIILDVNDLQVADNIQFTNSASRRKRGGQARFHSVPLSAGSTALPVVYAADAWSTTNAGKRAALVAVTQNLIPTNTTQIHYAPNWNNATTVFNVNRNTSANFIARHGGITSTVMTEDFILGLRQDGTVANTIRVWNNMATTANFVGLAASTGTLPAGWIVRSFRRRLFIAGNKADRDRLYYSDVGDPFDWGTGSGNITIGVEGDGDPEGITAIFPGTGSDSSLYVAKRKSLFRVNVADPSPANWTVEVISQGIGCINPNAVTSVDQMDVVFCSDRGVHTLSQVLGGQTYKESEFLSAAIHEDYQNFIDTAARDRISLVWYEPLNSILMSCKTENILFNTVYGFNVQVQKWFRWRKVPCNHLFTRFNNTNKKPELYACDQNGFINQLDQPTRYDFTNNAAGAITTQIRSSVIYPDGVPLQEKNFLGLGMVFRSRDTSTFRVQYKIDDETTTPILNYQQKRVAGNILGSSTLGVNFILGVTAGTGIKPVWNHLRGVGHSIEVDIVHDTPDTDFELFGMILEYSDAGEAQNAFYNQP